MVDERMDNTKWLDVQQESDFFLGLKKGSPKIQKLCKGLTIRQLEMLARLKSVKTVNYFVISVNITLTLGMN